MATKGEPLAPAKVAAGGGGPRPFPLQQELTGQHVAWFLRPGPSRPRAWCLHYTSSCPLPTGRAGTGLCQAWSNLSPFHRPIVLRPQETSLWKQGFVEVLEKKGKKHRAFGGREGRERRGEERPQPASEPVIAEPSCLRCCPAWAWPPHLLALH